MKGKLIHPRNLRLGKIGERLGGLNLQQRALEGVIKGCEGKKTLGWTYFFANFDTVPCQGHWKELGVI
jgi:hypothetical protein